MPDSPFIKSSYSLAECVEVRRVGDDTVLVRNSQGPSDPHRRERDTGGTVLICVDVIVLEQA